MIIASIAMSGLLYVMYDDIQPDNRFEKYTSILGGYFKQFLDIRPLLLNRSVILVVEYPNKAFIIKMFTTAM